MRDSNRDWSAEFQRATEEVENLYSLLETYSNLANPPSSTKEMIAVLAVIISCGAALVGLYMLLLEGISWPSFIFIAAGAIAIYRARQAEKNRAFYRALTEQTNAKLEVANEKLRRARFLAENQDLAEAIHKATDSSR